jgi:hypothetical protein
MKLEKYLILKIILNKKNYNKENMEEILEADLNFFKASSKIVHEKGEKKRKIKGCAPLWKQLCHTHRLYMEGTLR